VQQKVFASFAEAVADIPDGASIMIGGFGPGTPHNLIKALHEQGAKDLTIILNAAGAAGGGAPRSNVISPTHLLEDGRVRKAVMAFTASTHPSRRSVVEELEEAGKLETELVPQGTLAELAEGKEHRDFNGRTYLLEEAMTADYAFVRAWRADAFGNLVFRGSERNFNPIMATAARCTIVETEEILSVGSIDPNQVHTSGIYVSRLVQIPPDGIFHVPRQPMEPAQQQQA
jgi:3-oxoadipate CoA-transferase alpha subunit